MLNHVTPWLSTLVLLPLLLLLLPRKGKLNLSQRSNRSSPMTYCDTNFDSDYILQKYEGIVVYYQNFQRNNNMILVPWNLQMRIIGSVLLGSWKVMSQEIVVDIRIGKWKFKTGYIPGRDVPLYRLCIFFNIVEKVQTHV